jgi:hypothetical protein
MVQELDRPTEPKPPRLDELRVTVELVERVRPYITGPK